MVEGDSRNDPLSGCQRKQVFTTKVTKDTMEIDSRQGAKNAKFGRNG